MISLYSLLASHFNPPFSPKKKNNMNNNLTMLIHVYMKDKFIDIYMVTGMWSSYKENKFNLYYL